MLQLWSIRNLEMKKRLVGLKHLLFEMVGPERVCFFKWLVQSDASENLKKFGFNP